MSDLGAVDRSVERGEKAVLTISRVYPTTVEDLWDACTSAERIPRWFLPVSGELKLGGHYQLEGNAGGTVERCDPPRSFGVTWEFGGEVSWVDVSFEPAGDGARMTLVHTAHVDDERWTEYGPGAVGVGWDGMLHGMALHIASGEAVDMAAAMAWMTSDEGRAFYTDSSELWYAANVASGTPEAEARAAADRTTAAYTAQPG
jgi:uncharacterized protein YndB with AHSA1/START domain